MELIRVKTMLHWKDLICSEIALYISTPKHFLVSSYLQTLNLDWNLQVIIYG